MSDFALPAPIYPARDDAHPPSGRIRRGFRRLGLGLLLIVMGLRDILVGSLEAIGHWANRTVEVLDRGGAAVLLALGIAIAAIADGFAALVRAPLLVLRSWSRWAWQLTRPVLEAAAWLALAALRSLLKVLLVLGVAVLILAVTPLVGHLLDGVVRLAASLSDGGAAWLDDRLPTSRDLAALPWSEWGAIGARVMWAALAILFVGAAVAVLGFGLWLLALSAYVGGRSVLAATPPIVYGARRAGVTTLQALGFIAFLLMQIVAQSYAVLLIAALLAGAAWLVVAFGPELISAIRDIGSAEPSFTWIVGVLIGAATLLALLMFWRLFGARPGVRSRLVAAALALAVLAPLAWLAARPAARSSVGAFVEACLAFFESEPRRAAASRAGERGASPLPTPPLQAAEGPAVEAPAIAAQGEEGAVTESAQSEEESPTVVLYPTVETSWMWDSAELLAESAPRGDVILTPLMNRLDPSRTCDAVALVAVGAASSDGGRAYNEALAYRRGVRLGGLAEAAASACGRTKRPSVWVLNLGQSRIAPPEAGQRAPAVIAVGSSPQVLFDAEDGVHLDVPFDQDSYSKSELCLMAEGSNGEELSAATKCSPLAAD